MNIIYYCPAPDDVSLRLQIIIEVMVSLKNFEILSGEKVMEDHLRSPLADDAVIILQISSFSNLQNIITLKEFLIDHRIILILPDRDPRTVALGHTLRPRLITYRDSYFLDVAAVLSRMNFKARQDYSEDRLIGFGDQ
jgi:hypothetical protein